MGCCLGTPQKASSSSSSSLPRSQKLPRPDSSTYAPPKTTLEDRAPPPSADELETVKEVLSETTANPKSPLPFPEPRTKFHQQLVGGIAEIHEKQRIHVVDKMELEKLSPVPSEITGNSPDGPESEEASDFRSLSFSESVSTTTAFTEKREDDEEVPQTVFRSPAKLAPATTRKRDPMPKRDRVVGRSPNRRHDRSPGKRVIQSRERVRREPRPEQGESSGRRSRSPAVNRSVVNRSPSGRRTGKSPVRARVDSSDGGGSKLTRKSNIEGNDIVTDGGQSESLENPLVSLECFIFL